MSLKIEDKGKAKVVSLSGKMDVGLSMTVKSIIRVPLFRCA